MGPGGMGPGGMGPGGRSLFHAMMFLWGRRVVAIRYVAVENELNCPADCN